MVSGEITKVNLIKQLYKAITTEELAAFIGAGLSIPAGFKNWKEMLITNWTDSEKEMVNKELDFSTRFLQTSESKSEIKKAA